VPRCSPPAPRPAEARPAGLGASPPCPALPGLRAHRLTARRPD